jgi:uncharacterized protein YggE
MKNIFCCFSILVLAGSFTKLISQELPKPPIIEVSGNAAIKVVPDIMKWFLSIKVDSDDPIQAKKDNDKSVAQVIQILKEKGIEPKDMQTGGIKIVKNYDFYGTKVKTYSVSNDIWFTLNNISGYDDFTSELIQIDNLYINSTVLEYSKAAEIRIQARTDALLAAKKKAEEMAEVLGLTIGKPLFISEGSANYYPNPFNAETYVPGSTYSTTSTFSEGVINVEATVKVVFELTNK